MSLLKTAAIYGLTAAAGWGANNLYEALLDVNGPYSFAREHGRVVVVKEDEGLKIPADQLFETYKLSEFMQKKLDGFDKEYGDFSIDDKVR